MALLQQLDLSLFHFINSTMTADWLDPWFRFITHAHQLPLIRYFVVPSLIGWWIYARRSEALRGLLAMIVVIGAGDLISHRVIKPWIARPRPFLVESNNAIMRLEKPSGGFSFPSNHATNCFGGAGVIAWFIPQALPYVYVYAALVAYSRPYLGVHYPSDIIAGALLGTLLVFIYRLLCLRFFSSLGPANEKRDRSK